MTTQTGEEPVTTVRARLDKRMRLITLLMMGGGISFAVFCFLVPIFHLPHWLQTPGYVGFFVAWLSGLYAHLFGFRCPRCRESLAALLMKRPAFKVDPRIRTCPYCDLPFDGDSAPS
jgi:hypothetical protein